MDRAGSSAWFPAIQGESSMTLALELSLPIEWLSVERWEGTATLIAGFGAAIVVLVGFWIDRIVRRQAKRAEAVAGALQAVNDYLEAPYRIRRRSGRPEERFELVAWVSDIQSRLAFFEGMLATLGPKKVHDSYVKMVAAARKEAGEAMKEAWAARANSRDTSVSLTRPLYSHPETDTARKALIAQTRGSLGKRS
jgi:hypothetical protein